MKKNVLVFPCGSEVALEIHRSLRYSTHFNLIGASSVDDHGKFVFETYVGSVPFHNSPDFVDVIREIIQRYKIDAIYPAMDAVAKTFKAYEHILNCKVIGSPLVTTEICVSKRLTYQILKSVIPIPVIYSSLKTVKEYPVFIKPSQGYGSRGIFLAKNNTSASEFLKNNTENQDLLLCEYLPGPEYTIDCFTDRKGSLLFSGIRVRNRISNGISVNTRQVPDFENLFYKYAELINKCLNFRGAWFFQMKLDKNNKPKLLEVAARLGGSSALFRSKGVNFALLSAFDCFDFNVEVFQNEYEVELDRALSNKYKLDINYQNVYVDYDDCLLIENKINYQLIAFLYYARNQGKKLILITRHAGDLQQSLRNYHIESLFDQLIHLTKYEKKSDYISLDNSIFIDDSHSERIEVKQKCKVPVFSPDMVEALIN